MHVPELNAALKVCRHKVALGRDVRLAVDKLKHFVGRTHGSSQRREHVSHHLRTGMRTHSTVRTQTQTQMQEQKFHTRHRYKGEVARVVRSLSSGKVQR